MSYIKTYVDPVMCRKMECPCLGGVCILPDEPVTEMFCPRQSGCLEEFISKRLKESELPYWTYEMKTGRVLANPDAWPRIYTGDGKHHTPVNPEWKNERVLKIRKLTCEEACEALRRYEQGLPPKIECLK